MKWRGGFPHLTNMVLGYAMDYREVLVTGGTGFVGTHVCRALIARGFLPRLLVREGSEGRIPADVRSACRVTPGDITNRESVEYAVQGTMAVVHLVGIIRESPRQDVTFERLHVDATRNVVDAARRWEVSRLIHMSALGAGARPVKPAGYFDTKGRAEELVRQSGIPWTIFRPSVIFGPGDQFLGELAGILRIAPVVPVPGDGSYRLQPVFIGDVAKGFTDALLSSGTEGKVFEVGGPERFSYNELLDKVAASVGRRARKVHVPLSLLRPVVSRLQRYRGFPLTTDQLEMLLGESICDPDPFYSAFGFTPLSLSDYLSGGLGTLPSSPGSASKKSASGNGRFMGGETDGSKEQDPPLRKTA
ncbi:MAG: complex I NDUFA9 subunit family protein [Deltaproteobacteria bacterium]|nr:complex I NDUFA9 subunit family protein [Candidatus Deferrimicrobiaceae bacterium]